MISCGVNLDLLNCCISTIQHLISDQAKYNELRGFEHKARFRKQWAEQRYNEYRESRTFQESSSITERESGSYLPLARICHKEGGGESGRIAAMRYCMRCLELGGEWIDHCSFTGRIKFLYVIKGRDELHTRAWRRRIRSRLACQCPDTHNLSIQR